MISALALALLPLVSAFSQGSYGQQSPFSQQSPFGQQGSHDQQQLFGQQGQQGQQGLQGIDPFVLQKIVQKLQTQQGYGGQQGMMGNQMGQSGSILEQLFSQGQNQGQQQQQQQQQQQTGSPFDRHRQWSSLYTGGQGGQQGQQSIIDLIARQLEQSGTSQNSPFRSIHQGQQQQGSQCGQQGIQGILSSLQGGMGGQQSHQGLHGLHGMQSGQQQPHVLRPWTPFEFVQQVTSGQQEVPSTVLVVETDTPSVLIVADDVHRRMGSYEVLVNNQKICAAHNSQQQHLQSSQQYGQTGPKVTEFIIPPGKNVVEIAPLDHQSNLGGQGGQYKLEKLIRQLTSQTGQTSQCGQQGMNQNSWMQ